MSDDLTVLGPDGIRRSYDEHYGTMMDVEQDPTGAHHAIQTQHARVEELEKRNTSLETLIQELFTLLDKTEQTDEGRYFHPNRIYSSRALDAEKLENTLRLMKATVEDRQK